jgi:ectoine hydroxylase-related dioxygenase (phytanoyl-CoA dioxygenase family)
VVPPEQAAALNAEAHAVALPARAGDVVLLHNQLWHRSGQNTTTAPRRAFTVCFLDAATRCVRTRRAPRNFFQIFKE